MLGHGPNGHIVKVHDVFDKIFFSTLEQTVRLIMYYVRNERVTSTKILNFMIPGHSLCEGHDQTCVVLVVKMHYLLEKNILLRYKDQAKLCV